MTNSWEEYLRIVERWTSDYPSVNNLLRHLRYRKIGSESSRYQYCYYVYAFCVHTGKLPDELVVQKKADIEKMVEDYCYQKRENCWKSARTANTVLGVLKTFFKVNGFKGVEELSVEGFRVGTRERTKPQYIPTLEEARRMADVAGCLRNRAIILFLCSAGLRNSTLCALQYGGVKEELEKGERNLLIKVNKEMKKIVVSACKGNTEYFVFTSEEATKALRLYLNDRRRRLGELREDDVLFCAEYTRVPRSGRGRRPLTKRELEILVKEAACKAGIKEWKDVFPHCLRKTFDSFLRSQFADGGRLDFKTQEFFMGHNLGGSIGAYFDTSKVEDFRKEYAKLVFTSGAQTCVEALDSLQGMARVLGIDVAQLEEARKKELGRILSDLEKLSITQEAIKQLLAQFRNISESSNSAKSIVDVRGDKSRDNDAPAPSTGRKLLEETPTLPIPHELREKCENENENEKDEEKPDDAKHQISCNEQTQKEKLSPSANFGNCPRSELFEFPPFPERRSGKNSSSTFLVQYKNETWGKTLGRLVLSLGRSSGDVKGFYCLLHNRGSFRQEYSDFVIEHNGKDAYRITVLEKDLAETFGRGIRGCNL